MRRVLAIVLMVAACGGESKPAGVSNVVSPAEHVDLPTDAELGELAIMGTEGGPGSWVPAASFPFIVEGMLREGKGPPPSWRAFDGRAREATLTYGDATRIAYGCDGNEMPVTRLTGKATLDPGLVWLAPRTAPWKPRAAAITKPRPAAIARRELAVGDYTIEIVRTTPTTGVVNLVHLGDRMVHQMTFERGHMDGAPDEPIDLIAGGVGVPVPEVAWELDRGRLLVVFRVQSYEGVHFKTVVVGPDRGRTVESMGLYLYQCAF